MTFDFMSANDLVFYLRGYLEDKTTLNETELSNIKEQLKKVYHTVSYPSSPFTITSDRILLNNPGIPPSTGPTCAV